MPRVEEDRVRRRLFTDEPSPVRPAASQRPEAHRDTIGIASGVPNRCSCLGTIGDRLIDAANFLWEAITGIVGLIASCFQKTEHDGI